MLDKINSIIIIIINCKVKVHNDFCYFIVIAFLNLLEQTQVINGKNNLDYFQAEHKDIYHIDKLVVLSENLKNIVNNIS